MRKWLAAVLSAAMLMGFSPAVFAAADEENTDWNGCIYEFSEVLTEETTICFGDYLQLIFKGNYGTDKENLHMSTQEIKSIQDLLEDEDIDFYHFIAHPKFASRIRVKISADAESFLYEVQDGKILRVSDAEYKSDAWYFYTKKPGLYFITEEEYPEMDLPIEE